MLTDVVDRKEYAGNGVTTVFAVPFYFLEDSHVKAVLVDDTTRAETVWAITTNYTLTGEGDEDAGGELTALVAPATGKTLVIYRDPDVDQDTDYTNNEKRPGPALEESLDKLTMLVKRLKTQMSRAVRLPEGFTATFSTFLPATLTAGKVWIVNATEDGLEEGPTADEIENAQGYATAAAASEAAAAASETAAAASAAAAAADAASINGDVAAAEAAKVAAEAAQAAAETAETNAETAETNAETAETNAAASAAAAAASAAAAAASETAAQTAETNAETAENNAETAETNAEAAAAAAAASEVAAAASAAAAAASAGAAAPTIVGTRAAPTDVVGANGILFTSVTFETVNYVQGSGGSVTLSANPRIQAGSIECSKLRLVGCSDVNTITLEDGQGVDTAGVTYVIRNGTILDLMFDLTSSIWIVVGHNGV